jgi:hypothetical protein
MLATTKSKAAMMPNLLLSIAVYAVYARFPGIPTPMPGAPRGSYALVVDESGKKASWILELCDVPEYVASHLHIVSQGPHFT